MELYISAIKEFFRDRGKWRSFKK